MSTENSPAGTFINIRRGIEAAAEYVNSELGGVNGRPFAAETCITDASPESSVRCANGFVQSGKVAIMPGLDYGAAASVPIFTRAGLPYVGGLPLDAPELTAPNAFTFIGSSPGALGALSAFTAQNLQAKKVSFLHIDLPAGKVAAETFGGAVLTALGVNDITYVAESPTAADFTAAVTKANEGDPDAILVLFGSQACSRIMQAIKSLGIPSDKVLYAFSCGSTAQIEEGGGGADGSYFDTPFLPVNTDDDEVDTFTAAMEKYAPDAEVSTESQVGFNAVMNLYAILKSIQGEITPASITAALKATKDQPSFMGHPFTCDGQQVPDLPAPCNAHERIVQYRGGEFADVTNEWIEGVSHLGG